MSLAGPGRQTWPRSMCGPMQLDLVRATFLRRYQRFLADVRLADGQVVQAHVPNTGSMRSLLTSEVDAWLAPARDPQRRLRWTLVLLATPDGGLAVVDTGLPNQVVAEGIATGRIPELAGYGRLRREVAYGTRGSRIDLLLEDDATSSDCHVEVKNVTLAAADGRADFPDAVSARGRKHLEELADLARQGRRSVQFYLLDRSDRTAVGIASSIDPQYACALQQARSAGVEVLCYRASITPEAVVIGQRCPFAAPERITACGRER